jgi:hypothetical protein
MLRNISQVIELVKIYFSNQEGGIDWIDLAEDRDRWWALAYAVMNLQFP